MKKSVNYNLNKPDYSDQYDLRHWNDNTDIIDNQMKSEETSRINGDSTLQNNLNNEANARQQGDVDAKNLANATGILSVNNGGTGKSNTQDAIENLCSAIQEVSEVEGGTPLSETDYQVILSHTNSPINDVKKTKVSSLYNMIKRLMTSTLQAIIPTGTIHAFGGNNVPTGFLLCDGSAVSRTTYATLFSVIGTRFGVGDGATTFNLPNLTNKFLEGVSSVDDIGKAIEAGLPSINHTHSAEASYEDDHYHSYDDYVTRVGITDYALVQDGSGSYGVIGGIEVDEDEDYTNRDTFSAGGHTHEITIGNAGASSNIYGKSNTVQPPAVCVRYIIKYN